MLILLTIMALFAKEHHAIVEPYEIKTISSNVSARVVFADIAKEGLALGKNEYIMLDDELDKIELDKISKKIILLNNTIEFNEKIIQNYEELLDKKIKNFDRIKDLKIKSSVEKDREFYDLINSQNQYINTQKELENIKIQLNDLKLREAFLKKSVRDKHISSQGSTLYALLVKEGQFVNPSTPLAEIADLSKGKLTIYLSREEVGDAADKVIYIDGKKSKYKISKVWNIADSKHLSSYKAEIIVDSPELFSNLLKVELKDE